MSQLRGYVFQWFVSPESRSCIRPTKRQRKLRWLRIQGIQRLNIYLLIEPTLMKIVPGTTHGFATRPNLDIPEIKEAYQKAFEQTVEWFNKTLVVWKIVYLVGNGVEFFLWNITFLESSLPQFCRLLNKYCASLHTSVHKTFLRLEWNRLSTLRRSFMPF